MTANNSNSKQPPSSPQKQQHVKNNNNNNDGMINRKGSITSVQTSFTKSGKGWECKSCSMLNTNNVNDNI